MCGALFGVCVPTGHMLLRGWCMGCCMGGWYWESNDKRLCVGGYVVFCGIFAKVGCSLMGYIVLVLSISCILVWSTS